jgi:hypothetical protein
MKSSMQCNLFNSFHYKKITNVYLTLDMGKIDTYKTGEYVPLSQGGMSPVILLFTSDISPSKCDVFMFVTLRIPLKLF